MFHIVFLCKRKEGMSQAEFADYWINDHTPLTAKTPGVVAYRCYTVTGSDSGEWPPYDGVAVLSFADEAAYQAAMMSSEFGAALADAPNFQTTALTLGFHADEHIII